MNAAALRKSSTECRQDLGGPFVVVLDAPRAGSIEVTFPDGSLYLYSGLPAPLCAALRQAKSGKGCLFNKRVLNHGYPATRLTR